MQSNGKGLIALWTHVMASTQCMQLITHQNPCYAPLDFTRDASGGAEGNVDPTTPFCYEEQRIHAVTSTNTDIDHLLLFSQVRAVTPITANPIELRTVPPRKRVSMQKSTPLPTPTTDNTPYIARACSSIVRNATLSPPSFTVGDKAKSVIKLRANTISKMASVIVARPPRFFAVFSHVISAPPAAFFVVAGTPEATISKIYAVASATGSDVSILDNGATHHLWHSHEAFIS